MILEVLAGNLTVVEATKQLGISESRFHEMRKQMLFGAVEALEPGEPGRPREEVDPELIRLRQKNFELRREMEASKIREEIATILPELLEEETGREKRGEKTATGRGKKKGKRR